MHLLGSPGPTLGNTDLETESCGRGLSDGEIVSSMKNESDEQHLTGEVDSEISQDSLKCVLSDQAHFEEFRLTTPNNSVLVTSQRKTH